MQLQCEFAIELVNHLITLTCGPFQFLAVKNLYPTVHVFDDPFLLQRICSQAHARAVGTEHTGEKVVGNFKRPGINPVLGQKQPT